MGMRSTVMFGPCGDDWEPPAGAEELERSPDGTWRVILCDLAAMQRERTKGWPNAELIEKASRKITASRVAQEMVAIEREFAASHNPAHAWLGYHLCRQAELPLPPWIVAYLDECAIEVERAVWRVGLGLESCTHVNGRMGELFGFPSDRGRSSWISDRMDSGASEIGNEVLVEESANGGKRKLAAETVAARRGVSVTKARKCRAYFVAKLKILNGGG